MPLDESALVVLVPEAESLVQAFRDRYDPSAAAGVPAHITLLYPFRPPGEIDRAMLDDLRGWFQGFASFRFSLASGGKRALQSFAARVKSRTADPSISASRRYPSNLISCTQPSSDGGLPTRVAS